YQEYVGSYYDTATVTYTQDRSSLTDGFNGNGGFINDFDDSPARWRVDYYSSGVRHYVLSDSQLPSEPYYPDWASASGSQTGFVDRSIIAPTGYIGETSFVNNQSLWFQTLQTVGSEARHHSEWQFILGDAVYEANGGVELYSDINWGTPVSVRYTAGLHTIDRNDYYSSLKMSKGTRVTIYDNVGYTGDFAQYTTFSQSLDVAFIGSMNDRVSSLTVENLNWITVSREEYFNNYFYNWTSRNHDITDIRLKLFYQYVGLDHDIFASRPKFETGTSTVKVVDNLSVTQWETRNITESQTRLTTQRVFEDGPSALQGAFTAASLSAIGDVTITAGNDVRISALVRSTGNDQTLQFTAGRDALVEGLVPAGAEADVLPAVAQLASNGAINVAAGRDAHFDAFSLLGVDQDAAHGTTSQINVTAGRDIDVLGAAFTRDKIILTADGDIDVSGQLTATHLIQAAAGADGTGSIIGDINTQLTTYGSQIILTAGANAGDIALTNSTIDSSPITGFISLSAPAGSISQTGGVATGKQLKVRAALGISTNSAVSELDIQGGGAADVTIVNVGDVTFVAPLKSGSGITLLNFGNVLIGDATAGGDLSFTATGTFTQTAGKKLTSNGLVIESANGGYALTTDVTNLALVTRGVGDVVVTNMGTRTLTMSVDVTAGSLTLSTAGALNVVRAASLTNDESHDISLTAAGDLAVGFVSAGVLAETDADARRIRLSYLSGALRAAGYLAANAADLDDAAFAALDLAAARASLVNWLTTAIYAGKPNAATLANEEADRQLELRQALHTYGDITLISTGGRVKEVSSAD
ncbi:MAG TPA: hypothetical protein PLV92_14805, partial [Pirellulaceae bacterium]|nr:hypothetical protein [Pirellulaceae bacterium]